MAKAVGAKVDAGKAAVGNAAFAGKQVLNSGIYHASAIGNAVGAKVHKAKTTLKTNATDLVAKVTDPIVNAYQRRKAQRTINQRGGASHNRTRYISDIKHNRKRLYDREREIIQSIRNFENNNNNNNNRKESRHHKTRKLRNILMRR